MDFGLKLKVKSLHTAYKQNYKWQVVTGVDCFTALHWMDSAAFCCLHCQWLPSKTMVDSVIFAILLAEFAANITYIYFLHFVEIIYLENSK